MITPAELPQIDTEQLSGERADLLDRLGMQRTLFRYTAQGLTDEQACSTPTISALSVGGLIKHVAYVEMRWANFIVDGAPAMASGPDGFRGHATSFVLLPGETLAGVLDEYAAVAARTDELIRTLPDFDASHELPKAPWFPPNARWTARRTLLHILAETAQHAGHADIIREAIDGQKSMG
jgi:hypothetical protein